MAKVSNWIKRKPGLPPGTPVFVGEQRTAEVNIDIIDYDADACREQRAQSPADTFPFRDRETVTWINVSGVHDVQLIEEIAGHFGIHPLVQEDIVNTVQRPKLEEYDGYQYMVIRMIRQNPDDGGVLGEQVSLVHANNCVITFQEEPGDVFDLIRDRIRNGKGRIRRMGADYLFYALLDAVVDSCFLVLEEISERMTVIETEAMEEPTSDTLRKIQHLKRDLVFLRKSVWPLRDAVSSLDKAESTLMTAETRVFVRDLYDHAIQLIDTVETCRDVTAGLFDIYLSNVSNRMNEVMKVLTIMATIFIPITFVAGVYGMNFAHMPELDRPWAYPAVLVLMAAIAGGMLLYFRKKDWL